MTQKLWPLLEDIPFYENIWILKSMTLWSYDPNSMTLTCYDPKYIYREKIKRTGNVWPLKSYDPYAPDAPTVMTLKCYDPKIYINTK